MSSLEAAEAKIKTPYDTEPQAEGGKEESTEVVEQTAQETPIYLGGKKFGSVDELAAYASQLEKERATQAPQQTQTAQGKRPSELIFEDPEKALELHEQQIVQKLRAQEEARNQEKAWWDQFYSANKDLSEDRDVVQFSMEKNWGELKSMNPEQASKKLADYTRQTLSRFRKTTGQKQELPSGQAKAAPSNGYTGTKVEETKAAPVDFVTQLKKIQSKRK